MVWFELCHGISLSGSEAGSAGMVWFELCHGISLSGSEAMRFIFVQ